MHKEIIKEIGERINNGEDLISIKADLNSRGVEFNQYENFSKSINDDKNKINILKIIQDYLISFCFIFGLATILYNLSEIKNVKIYLLIIIIILFLYYKYFKFYILEFAYDLNKYFRIIILMLALYFISKYNSSFKFNNITVESGVLNSINTN